MHKWTWLLALLVTPAFANDDLDAMNAVSQAWDGYVTAYEAKDPATVDHVAASTLAHYAFLRDAARFASREQVQRLPSADRIAVYGLRARHDDAGLAAMDGREVYRTCVEGGLCGAMAEHAGIEMPPLAHVTLVSPRLAVGEAAPSDGQRYVYGPTLVLENGQWRVRAEGLTAELSQLIDGNGGTDGALLAHLVGHYTGKDAPLPLLSQLDQPLADDAAARRRLNEDWPRYDAHIRERVEATRVKAEAGESLAQWMYGGVLYAGSMPDIVPQDKEAGLAMIEAASNGGNTDAAMGASMALLDAEDPATLPPATVTRALPHLQRAAMAGNPMAMAAYAQFHVDGAAGLARDCTQAAQWLQKAEDAGLEEARNNRVWVLSTCAQAEQRDAPLAMELASHMIAQRDRLPATQLDTLAAVHAANDDFPHAMEYQQLALDRLGADEAHYRSDMQARLALYRSGRAYVDTETDYRSEP